MYVKRIHHGGEPAEGILYDFSTNLNPLGPPESVRYAILNDPDCLIRYPDPECLSLRKKLSENLDVPVANIVCGSGASDLIYRICAAGSFSRVLLAVPTFTEYQRALAACEIDISYLYTAEENGFCLAGEYLDCGDGYDAIIVCNPGNPSGRVMDAEEADRLLTWCQETDTLLITDECFLDFAAPAKVAYAHSFFQHYVNAPAGDFESVSDAVDAVNASAGESDPARRRNPLDGSGTADGAYAPEDEGPDIPEVIAIRSLTKSYAVAGLRIGYALFTDAVRARVVADYGPPWAVSGPAQAAGLVAADSQKYLEKTRAYVAAERAYLTEHLRAAGLKPLASDVNYILFKGPKELGRQLRKRGIRIRECAEYLGLADRGGQRYFRIGVQEHECNEALAEALPEAVAASRRAVNIMIQGTMSNAGKSILAAGLCRIFAQDGYQVAPFKSQNMALNSYITGEGLEIGRAQAVQAEAAGVEPSADMNPVLLKPTTDEGSQVIVQGVARGNMKAAEYFRYKKALVPEIMEAYDRLAAEYEIVVIEGAGSPVELNLREGDIVNMGLARMTDAPVVLVGDIDRGGIFAQLTGTLDLLPEEDRERVIGVVVNKFRGDRALFERGRQLLEELCETPVLGVVPYMELDIDDEDSLSERFTEENNRPTEHPADEETARDLIICVIRLPRISNFSDLTALGAVDGVTVRYVDRPEQMDDADAIIIPGTKSTISDLKWMNVHGLADAVWLAAMAGTPVLGICGGFQMLGRKITDPHCFESLRPETKGIGLLPIETEYEQAKVTRQTAGRVAGLVGDLEALTDLPVNGYEIHMGRSRIVLRDRVVPPVEEESGLAPDILAASWGDGVLDGSDWAAQLTGPQRADARWRADITPFCQLEDGSFDGCVSGNVMGTYLHGLFDSAAFTEGFLALLHERARSAGSARPDTAWLVGDEETADLGEDARQTRFAVPDYDLYRQAQYDKLAEGLRASLDMDVLYELLGLPGPKEKAAPAAVVDPVADSAFSAETVAETGVDTGASTVAASDAASAAASGAATAAARGETMAFSRDFKEKIRNLGTAGKE